MTSSAKGVRRSLESIAGQDANGSYPEIFTDAAAPLLDDLRKLSNEQLARLASGEEIEGLSLGGDREFVISGVLLVMAELSPDEALKFMLAHGKKLGNSSVFEPAMDFIAKSDPKVFAAWLQESGNFGNEPAKTLARIGLRMLAAHSAADAMRVLESNGPQFEGIPVTGLFREMAARDPDGLLSLIARSDLSKEKRDQMMRAGAEGMAANRPDDAIRLIGEIADKTQAGAAACQFLQEWLGRDPIQAAAHAKKMSPNALLSAMSLNVFPKDKMIAQDPSLVKNIVQGVVLTSSNAGMVSDMVEKAAAASPGETLDWVAEMDPSPMKDRLVASTFESWALTQKSAEDISARLATLNEADRTTALKGLASTVGARAVTEEGLKALAQWVEALPEANRAAFSEEALLRMAVIDPSKAASGESLQNLTANMDEEGRGNVNQQIAVVWASRDLEGAVNWVEGIRGGVERKAAVEGLVKGWVGVDPQGAAAWLSEVPLGPDRDAGIRVLIDAIKDTDPERANEWLGQLTEAGK